MPNKPARPCKSPRCPQVTQDPSGYCDKHKKQAQRQQDQERGSANARGYNYRWQIRSKRYLAEHPLCAICQKKNPPVVRGAAVVDHIIPHKGNYDLFWDESNWQSACKECHDIKTATEDGAFGWR